MSENKEILFEQYKLYTEIKDRFVDRNFLTNKFYTVLVILLFVIIFLFPDVEFKFGLNSLMIMSAIGMGISFLWWANMDAYNTLIRIKMGSVIDKMEEQLPMPCSKIEKDELDELKRNKKAMIFSDMQKSIALGTLLTFMVLFLFDYVPVAMKLLFG